MDKEQLDTENHGELRHGGVFYPNININVNLAGFVQY